MAMTTDEVLVSILARMEMIDRKYLEALDECDVEAKVWRNQGDMYGWNFHQGRRGGMVEMDIYYRVLKRELVDLRKSLKAGGG